MYSTYMVSPSRSGLSEVRRCPSGPRCSWATRVDPYHASHGQSTTDQGQPTMTLTKPEPSDQHRNRRRQIDKTAHLRCRRTFECHAPGQITDGRRHEAQPEQTAEMSPRRLQD